MNQILFFLLGLILGGLAVWFIVRLLSRSPELIKKQAEEKEENKKRISDFLSQREKASNNEIEQLLGVSDSTATRYLEEMEKEGKVRNVGRTGRGVYYEKI